MAKDALIPEQMTPGIWALATERTRDLVRRAAFFDGDLKRMLANAYIQGVTDVANNFEIKRL